MSAVADRLRARIRARGPIPFAEFMEEALYGEGGYYARLRPAIGRDGDYLTGSALSPLFGRATARLLVRLDRELGEPAALLEAGYGGGEHLAAVAEAAGVGRRLVAWDRVPRPVPEGVERLAEPEELGERSLDGLVFSYELFDALAVHRLVGLDGGGLGELLVTLDGEGRFGWLPGALSDPRLAALLPVGTELEPGQIADLAPGWAPLHRRLASRLGRGLVVTCDYGFPASRLLDVRVRRYGTLACYRRHTVHRDPFRDVGRQDLTAHVDFDALRRAGEQIGLQTVTLTRQARWLLACGLFDELEGASAESRAAARRLLDGDGMGEEIRVLVQAREVDAAALLDPEMLGG